jgi:hypothetical protein
MVSLQGNDGGKPSSSHTFLLPGPEALSEMVERFPTSSPVRATSRMSDARHYCRRPVESTSRRLDEALFIANANWAAWGSLREAWPALSVWHLEHSLREWTQTG